MSVHQATGQIGRIVPWRQLERWRSRAFFVAGLFLLGFVTSTGLWAFTSISPPRWVNVVSVVPGLLAGHFGLLGLYPELSERVPRLSQVGAVVVVIAWLAGIGILAIEGLNNFLIPGILRYFEFFYLVSVLGTIIAFVLFGIVQLFAAIHTRVVGLALLGPPIVLIIMGTTGLMAGGNPPQWSTFIFSAMQACAHLAIGYVLSTRANLIEPGKPATDASTG